MPFSQFDERVLRTTWISFDASNTPTTISPLDAGPFGSRIDACVACNSDVVDHVLDFYIDAPSPQTKFGSVTLPARAGYDGAKGVDVIAALAPESVGAILMSVGQNVAFGVADTLLALVAISVVFWYADF